MPEHVPEPPMDTEEEKKPKEDEGADVEEHLEKIYKAIGQLTEAARELASYLKSSQEAHKALAEAVKSELGVLKDEILKLRAGFAEAAAANKEQDKFPTTGKPQVSETGEEVTYPPEQLREVGRAMLEKSIKDIKKSVVTPRPEGVKMESPAVDKGSDLVRQILFGGVKPGEIPKKIREVIG